MKSNEFINEGWSQKYKSSINCSHPKGFSQKAHCAGKKKHNESIEMEMTCEDCGMCKTHGSLNEIKKGQKDSNGFTKCWPNKHAEGTKKGKNGGQVRACVPNESQGVEEGSLNELSNKLVNRVANRRSDNVINAKDNFDINDPKTIAALQRARENKIRNDYLKTAHVAKGNSINPTAVAAAKADVDYRKYKAKETPVGGWAKNHVKPKHMSEDDQIDGMAKGEIQAIIDNATHIQRALEQGINLDGWMYSYVTVCNDHMNSVAEQIGNPDIDEEIDTQINEKNPGLWANIHAKQNRIKHGSGEHMRKPGSKGAPSNSDFKSINAAAKKESIDEELNRQFDAVEAMVDHLAEQHGLDSDTIWDLFETVSDGELLSETAAWQKSSGKNKNGGLNQKGVNSYRREHPGSKLKTAVTTKPSKLKKGGKAANRRKSFCARMKGMKKANTSAKTARDPDSRINKSLRKWNC